jgi:hypothetical protein
MIDEWHISLEEKRTLVRHNHICTRSSRELEGRDRPSGKRFTGVELRKADSKAYPATVDWHPAA